MTRKFEDQDIVSFDDRNSAAVFQDIEFRRCRFDGCDLSITDSPRLRSTVRRVSICNCNYVGHGLLGAAIVEDSIIDGLKTFDLLQTWGMVFKHVVLRGKIDRIMLSDVATTSPFSSPRVNETFKEANAAFYHGIDWALDISVAEFKECDIRGIPARLIRRDPQTQAVVTREKALEGKWREIDLSDTYWDTSISFLLDRNDADKVLVAPKRSKAYPQLLDGIKRLRDAGVAEPD